MKPKTVNEYIDGFPEEQRAKLIELRKILRTTMPDTNEALKWGTPATIDRDGMILIVFSGHKNHMNLVATPSTRAALQSELKDYKTGKGSVQLSYKEQLPTDLIKKIATYRLDEYRNHGVKWM